MYVWICRSPLFFLWKHPDSHWVYASSFLDQTYIMGKNILCTYMIMSAFIRSTWLFSPRSATLGFIYLFTPSLKVSSSFKLQDFIGLHFETFWDLTILNSSLLGICHCGWPFCSDIPSGESPHYRIVRFGNKLRRGIRMRIVQN